MKKTTKWKWTFISGGTDKAYYRLEAEHIMQDVFSIGRTGRYRIETKKDGKSSFEIIENADEAKAKIYRLIHEAWQEKMNRSAE